MTILRLKAAGRRSDKSSTADAADSDHAEDADLDGDTGAGMDVAESRNPIVQLAEAYRETVLDLFRRSTDNKVDQTDGDRPA